MQSHNASTPAEHRDATAWLVDGLFEAPKGRSYTSDGTRADRSMTVAQIVAVHDQPPLKQRKHLKQAPETQCTCALFAAPGSVIIGFYSVRRPDAGKYRPAMPHIKSEGYGKKEPIASNATAQGRAQNRRVEIEVSAGAKP